VVVDRGHQEHALAGALEIEHLDDDRERLDHEEPADDAENELVLGGHRDRPERAAKRERAGIAHEHRRGWRVIPKKAQAPADQPRDEDQDLARARHVMQAEILGKVGAPHRVGDHAQRGRGDHHRHDRQPVKPVGEVDRIGRAHDHEHRKGDEENAEIDQHILEHRQGQLILQARGVVVARPDRGNERDGKAEKQPHPARHALDIAARDLGIIIGKADERKAERDEQHQPHERVVEPCP